MFRFNWEGTHYIKIWLLRVCCGSSQWFIVVVACEILIVVMLSSDTKCWCRASFSSPQNTCSKLITPVIRSLHSTMKYVRERRRTLSRIKFYIVWLWLCCRTLELKHTNTTFLLLFNVAENYSEWILATSALKGETLNIQFYSIEASGSLYSYKIIKE